MKSYLTTKRLYLCSIQRLEFCKNYEGWTLDGRETTVFSDEANIQGESDGDHRKGVEKINGKAFRLCFDYINDVSCINYDMGLHF